ncbi:hypothetical protein K491DRAFT_195554 [Lophiostoma macrostomum CBS 122681]|uniref:Secreted protein n=1 Tax=Lophiostoma macrostomum CBS 122681 TaxID=1314788 RepID=A0A6A6THQ7_9PLEO|nr:hypothetical protein K491DRAFT_195554 [Lophiostoma macrostomum CBS 122681]
MTFVNFVKLTVIYCFSALAHGMLSHTYHCITIINTAFHEDLDSHTRTVLAPLALLHRVTQDIHHVYSYAEKCYMSKEINEFQPYLSFSTLNATCSGSAN